MNPVSEKPVKLAAPLVTGFLNVPLVKRLEKPHN
jgi:hypothetical protein